MLYAVLFEDIEHEIEENRGKTSAVNLKVK